MIKFRKNVFETNSSSTHSLVYSKNPTRGMNYEIELDEFHGLHDILDDNVLNITFGYYGWGPCLLRESREKLSYLLTQIANEIITLDDQENLTWNEIVNKLLLETKFTNVLTLVKEKCLNIKGFKFTPFLDPRYRYFNQADDDEDFDPNKPVIKYTMYPVGHIDHQSWGTAYEETPERLIFDESILIIIDNDNGDIFYDYKPHENGIWHADTKTWEAFPDTPPAKDPEELFTIRDYWYDGEADW